MSEQIKCWATGDWCQWSPTSLHACTRRNEATDRSWRYHPGPHECRWCGMRWGGDQ